VVDLEDGRREQALGSALDLFSLAGGGSARGLRPPKGDTWLVYLCLARKVAAWVVTESGIRFRWVPGTREELAARIGRMGELAGARAGDTGTLRGLAAELFAELIDLPPAALCESCRLVIVPDGEIAAAPFSALVDSQGAFLGLTVPVIRAHRLPPPPGQRGLAGHGLLLMAGAAVERPGLTLPRLPEVEVEAQYVAASAPASILAGSALAADRLKELAPAAAWLHFAGHGYANAGNGALFTAGAGGAPISASQIAKMNWSRCELAVLSACWAGAGESRGFVNPESLVQAFLTAGARGVVAPVWAIDSAGAAGWMREFYSAMRRGMDAPLAIREASRRLSRQAGFELPYYWASFAYFT
jgi:CHAT domain-containing protein